jgi:DNA polymerase-3 subunit gamma/tau
MASPALRLFAGPLAAAAIRADGLQPQQVRAFPAAAGGPTWPEMVAALSLSGLARELALNCELRQLEGAVCLLRLPQSQAHLQMKPSPDKLQQALSEYLGRSVTVRIELGQPESETPAATAGRERQARLADAVDAIEQDIFVRDAIDVQIGRAHV